MHFETNTKDLLCGKMDVVAVFFELTCLTSEVVVVKLLWLRAGAGPQ